MLSKALSGAQILAYRKITMTDNAEMLERLTAILHTLACSKEHPERMEALISERSPSFCYYYLEESLAEEAEKTDHHTWQKEAESLCQKLSLSPVETLRLMMNLLELRAKLDQLLSRFPTGAGFARLVLFDDPL